MIILGFSQKSLSPNISAASVYSSYDMFQNLTNEKAKKFKERQKEVFKECRSFWSEFQREIEKYVPRNFSRQNTKCNSIVYHLTIFFSILVTTCSETSQMKRPKSSKRSRKKSLTNASSTLVQIWSFAMKVTFWKTPNLPSILPWSSSSHVFYNFWIYDFFFTNFTIQL